MHISTSVLTSGLLFLVALTGCSSASKASRDNDEHRGELICTQEAVTGSRIKRKVCRSPQQIAHEREQSKKTLNRALGTAGATSSN